jgi:3-dehydroquinate dehydratase
MSMRKVAALAAATVMSLGALTACSGGSYCDDLKSMSDNKELKDFDPKKPDTIQKAIDASEKLEGSAPDDLKDDWKVLIEYMKKVKDAGGDMTKMAALASETQKVGPASEAISKHAKDECKIDSAGLGN